MKTTYQRDIYYTVQCWTSVPGAIPGTKGWVSLVSPTLSLKSAVFFKEDLQKRYPDVRIKLHTND